MSVSLCLGWRVGPKTSPLLPPWRHQLSLADNAGHYTTGQNEHSGEHYTAGVFGRIVDTQLEKTPAAGRPAR